MQPTNRNYVLASTKMEVVITSNFDIKIVCKQSGNLNLKRKIVKFAKFVTAFNPGHKCFGEKLHRKIKTSTVWEIVRGCSGSCQVLRKIFTNDI